MGPAYYVIAILGCGDASAACTPVATVPVQYVNVETCRADTAHALAGRTDFDFPTLVAECRAVAAQPLARGDTNDRPPAGALQG
jgi:hypothetical protein